MGLSPYQLEQRLAELASGVRASGVIRIESGVIEAETLTIGDDVYEVEIVDGDTTDDTGTAGDFNNTTDPLTVNMTVALYAAMAPGGTDEVAVGDLYRIGDEMLEVTSITGQYVTFIRGISGTTNAVHANSQTIYEGDGIVAGSTIALGMVGGTLTAAAFTDKLIADINRRGSEPVRAIDIDDNEILVISEVDGNITFAMSETLADGANNEVEAAVDGGQNPRVIQMAIASRVPTAMEVTHENMHFAFDFDPIGVLVQILVTSSGLDKLWIGQEVITVKSGDDPAYVTLDNAGGTDWAATDTVRVYAFG